jgi:hypothetical protein
VKSFRISLILVLAFAFIGCAPKLPPNVTLTPIAKTAVYGRQFVIAGNGALRGLDTVMSTGVLPATYGIPVLEVMRRVGVEAQRLADVLTALDEATAPQERADAVSRAQAIVAQMSRLIDSATIPIPDEKVRATVSSALATLSAILRDFGDSIALLISDGSVEDAQTVAADLRSIPWQWPTSPLLYARR